MGMNMFGSRSSYSSNRCNCNRCSPSGLSTSSIDKTNKLPNPDPKVWILKNKWEHKNYLLIDIMYPNCTNYEGRKLLLYKGITWKDLEEQKTIDPHFSDNKKFYSPMARFEPTIDGWHNAMLLVLALTRCLYSEPSLTIGE